MRLHVQPKSLFVQVLNKIVQNKIKAPEEKAVGDSLMTKEEAAVKVEKK